MRKNTTKYLVLTVFMINVAAVAMAQQKPSDKKLSAEVLKIKKIQSDRNVLIGRTKQPALTAGSETNFQAPGNAANQPAFSRAVTQNTRPSQQPLQVPVRSRPPQKSN